VLDKADRLTKFDLISKPDRRLLGGGGALVYGLRRIRSDGLVDDNHPRCLGEGRIGTCGVRC